MPNTPTRRSIGGPPNQDHPKRCTARTSSGERCKKWAIRGGTVCGSHGGRAPQVRAAADRVLAREAAVRSVEALMARASEHIGGLSGVAQLEQAINYAGAMSTAYRWLLEGLQVEASWAWEDVPGAGGAIDRRVVVSEPGMVGPDHKGDLRLHPYEEGLRYWTKLHGQLLKDAATLGLEERKTRIHEDHVNRIGEAIRTLVSGLGRSIDDPDVVPVVEAALGLIAGERP